MSRPYKAGLAMGQAIVEMVHLMYQNQTAAKFYQGIFAALGGEFERRNITSQSSGRVKHCAQCGIELDPDLCIECCCRD